MASAMPDLRLPSQPQGINRPLTGTKLYCLVRDTCVNNLRKVGSERPESGTAGNRTRDISSQHHNHYTTWPHHVTDSCIIKRVHWSATQVRSVIPIIPLDFVVNRLFMMMKLFKTGNIDVAKCCQDHFGFDLPSVSWSKRVKKFGAKFHAYTIVK